MQGIRRLTWHVFSHNLEGRHDVGVVQVKAECTLLWDIGSSKSWSPYAVRLQCLYHLPQTRKYLMALVCDTCRYAYIQEEPFDFEACPV